MVAEERAAQQAAVDRMQVPLVAPLALVADYLRHAAYARTLGALSLELGAQGLGDLTGAWAPGTSLNTGVREGGGCQPLTRMHCAWRSPQASRPWRPCPPCWWPTEPPHQTAAPRPPTAPAPAPPPWRASRGQAARRRRDHTQAVRGGSSSRACATVEGRRRTGACLLRGSSSSSEHVRLMPAHDHPGPCVAARGAPQLQHDERGRRAWGRGRGPPG